MRMIHIGKAVPKELAKLGWREISSMHLGHGCWVLGLEKLEEAQALTQAQLKGLEAAANGKNQ